MTAMLCLHGKNVLPRINAAVLEAIVLGGVVFCALAASIYDIGSWISAW